MSSSRGKAGGPGHTNNSDQSAPKADPDGPPAPIECHRKLCTAQSWVSCAIYAIPKRSLRFHRCSERALEQAGTDLAREMHVMGICVMLGRHADSLYRTRHELSLLSAGRLGRASDDAASA